MEATAAAPCPGDMARRMALCSSSWQVLVAGVTHDDPVDKRPDRVFGSVDEVTGRACQDGIA
jgi:hypothetical protein